MKPATTILVAALVAIGASYATVKAVSPQSSDSASASKRETATQRIDRTGTIRCGYVAWPPYIIKDANTGQLSGIFYDLTEDIAKVLNLKVEWTTETSFGTMIEDMKTSRFDVYCGGNWPEASKSRHIDFTNPAAYVALGVYVRADDTRFDTDMYALNNKDYKFATQDGEMSATVVHSDFPEAAVVSHTQTTDFNQLIMDVVSKKADAVVTEKAIIERYMKANPGTLKNVATKRPVRLFGVTWSMLKGNEGLLSSFNTTINELDYTGVIERDIRKYDPTMSGFYPVALPFRQAD